MELLERGAESLGIHLSDAQLEQFGRYHRELAQWNARVNLTSISGCEQTQVTALFGFPYRLPRPAASRRRTGVARA